MRYGVCADWRDAEKAAGAGYDYIELNLSSLAAMDKDEFGKCENALKNAGIKCESTNCFFPGDVKIIGPEADMDKITQYCSRTFDRASRLGLETAVLGSGAARRAPAGFDMDAAMNMFNSVLKTIGNAAKEHGITVALEPLNPGETNIVCNVRDGLNAVKRAGREDIRLTADLYHIFKSGESMDALASSGGEVFHVHISNPIRRRYPKPGDGYDYEPFRNALRACGYDGRISIEAGTDDIGADLPEALKLLKTF